MAKDEFISKGKCPILGGGPSKHSAKGAAETYNWWPNQINLKALQRNERNLNPLGVDFNYAEEFKKLDLQSLEKDLQALMTDSKTWWPADYGHYGPFFIRMAWHSAGTYRIGDGRGGAGAGMLRFAPLNSWPDNGNLDKARRLLWPIKQKYGRRISWADLMIFTGNCALESMGFKTFGFAGGREDVWEPEDDVYWGPETEWLADERYTGVRDLEQPLGAVQMGLIYVNPEGPNGEPNPLAAAVDIRETFGRMAMDDYETVALIAGGHTFGKGHGAADPEIYVGPEPEAAGLIEQGMGWKNSFKSGKGSDTITSGLEGAWTENPIRWDNNYFENLFGYEWEKTKSPAGAIQWVPVNDGGQNTVPDAHDASKSHKPIMFTTDLALKLDPAYNKISRQFLEKPSLFAEYFSKAWYKLTHRDMGPYVRGLGPLVPKEAQLWQDPIPVVNHNLVTEEKIEELKKLIYKTGISTPDLVKLAWASASTYRDTDKRGGANGARIRLSPQKDWVVNEPERIIRTIDRLQSLRTSFNAKQNDGTKVSLADLIVLGGCAAIERAAGDSNVKVKFSPGRMDADIEQTDTKSFSVLEPMHDGFRNYFGPNNKWSACELLIEKAQMLKLSANEMCVLLGGMRVLNAVYGENNIGVLTNRPGILSNDFFVNLLDMNINWTQAKKDEDLYEGVSTSTGKITWIASSVDLLFGSNSQLRALSEVFASDDYQQEFIRDFAVAWAKVMDLDRFDL